MTIKKYILINLIIIFFVNYNINADKISMEIEDAIINVKPEKLMRILSKVELTKDEKRYDLNLARYISFKLNEQVYKSGLPKLKLLIGSLNALGTSLFLLYNIHEVNRGVPKDIALYQKKGSFCAGIALVISICKMYKIFTKYEERRKRDNAYAIESIIQRAKEPSYFSNE